MEPYRNNDNPRDMHPQKSASILSRLFFCWTIQTVRKGYTNNLNAGELHGTLSDDDSGELGDKLEEAWRLQMRLNKTPSLAKAVWIVFGYEICASGIILLVTELGSKIRIAKLMIFYVPNQASVSINEAYLYSLLIILAAFINTILGHNYTFRCQHIGMKVRVACCSLIYRKALKLTQTAAVHTTVGQMINLLSNDVNRFDILFMNLHNFWMVPIQIVVVGYLLYFMMGPYALTGIALFLLIIPLQMFLGKKSAEYRQSVAIKTDERLRLINEIIGGIQVIKMHTWEKIFTKSMENIRKLELVKIRFSLFTLVTQLSFTMYANRCAIFIAILSYTLMGNTPTAYYVFVGTALYNVLQIPMVIHVPRAISRLAEASVTFKRLESFLQQEEVVQREVHTAKSNKDSSGETCISLQEVSAKWEESSKENILTNINLDIHRNELVAITGTVGSGKSSLLHIILNELPILKGTLSQNGTISYASQEPWLFNGTIRENILFGQKMDPKRYQEVCRVCSLEEDFSIFLHGDYTIVGEKGNMLSGGQKMRVHLARSVYREADIYLFDDPLSAVDPQVGRAIFENCIVKYLDRKCRVLVTHQLQYLKNVSRIFVTEHGTIDYCGNLEDIFGFEDEYCKSLSSDQPDKSNFGENGQATDKISYGEDKTEERDHRHSKPIDSKIYRQYIHAGGHRLGLVILLIFLAARFTLGATDYFVTYWVNIEVDKNNTLVPQHNETFSVNNVFTETENCLYVYSALICFVILITLIRILTFVEFCMQSSKHLYNKMFTSILNAALRFFYTNPSGRIFNRFSKDMGSIDEVLPAVLLDSIAIFINAISVILLIGVVSPWNIIPALLLLALFYWLSLYFLPTNRNLKRIEATDRSPVFSYIDATIRGLTTIRAFDVQENVTKDFDMRQNVHTSAFYMLLACQRSFGLWLDLLCVFYTGIVTVSFLLLNETYGGNVGLAITQSLTLAGALQWGMRQWCELENLMTSVERVVEYAELDSECVNKAKYTPTNWPTLGNIEFQNVCLNYESNDTMALNNISFTVASGEKIGIVGRTGAGKSSLVTALFRIADISGSILIDNVDTTAIDLNLLRSKVSIIPQEPYLFSGTLRMNLDPFEKYPDNHLWDAFKKVELEKMVRELPNGLDSMVIGGGSNFSVGQKQLICFARAIINGNQILVLDEATANVDLETDEAIQRTLRRNFQQCTILTIAHRLRTVMDSDKILVMNAGSLVEFGDPHTLLQNENGTFYGLIKSAFPKI